MTRCECYDPGCPCRGSCVSAPHVKVRRVDMGHLALHFCESCAEDALASGLFQDVTGGAECESCADVVAAPEVWDDAGGAVWLCGECSAAIRRRLKALN